MRQNQICNTLCYRAGIPNFWAADQHWSVARQELVHASERSPICATHKNMPSGPWKNSLPTEPVSSAQNVEGCQNMGTCIRPLIIPLFFIVIHAENFLAPKLQEKMQLIIIFLHPEWFSELSCPHLILHPNAPSRWY